MTTRTKVNDAVARTARGGAQGGVAYSIDVLIASFAHLTNEQFGAILVLLTALVSAVQLTVENRLGVALLRDVPAKPPAVPLVAETPAKKTTPKKKTTARKR